MLTGQPGSTADSQHCHVQKVTEIEDDMGGPDPSLGNGNETTTVSTVELSGILCLTIIKQY